MILEDMKGDDNACACFTVCTADGAGRRLWNLFHGVLKCGGSCCGVGWCSSTLHDMWCVEARGAAAGVLDKCPGHSGCTVRKWHCMSGSLKLEQAHGRGARKRCSNGQGMFGRETEDSATMLYKDYMELGLGFVCECECQSMGVLSEMTCKGAIYCTRRTGRVRVAHVSMRKRLYE